MADERVDIVVSAKDRTDKAFKEVRRNLRGVGSEVSSLKAMLAGLGIGAVFTGLGLQVFSTAKEFQGLRASLETVTGSAATAAFEFERLQEFAKETPYQLNEVIGAFIKLKALGLDASSEALRSYGNTASAMGKSLNDVIEAVADATVGEFERLKEFGIKARSEGDNVTFTFRGVSTTIRKEAGAIEEYIRKLGDLEFAGGMERQMDTIGGATSNLKDAWTSFLDVLGDESGAVEGARTGILSLAEAINALRRAIKPTVEEELADLRTELQTIDEQLVEADRYGEKGWFGKILGATYGAEGLKERREEIATLIAELEQKQKDLADKASTGDATDENGSDGGDDDAAKRAFEARMLGIEAENRAREEQEQARVAYLRRIAAEEEAAAQRIWDLKVLGVEAENRAREEQEQATLARLRREREEAEQTYRQITEFGVQASRNIQSAFADYLFDPFDEGLKGMLSGFLDVVRRMAAESASSQILGGLFGGLAQSSNPVLAAFGKGFSVKHDGGLVLHEGGLVPRFHAGGLASDERPAILQTGERVLSREQSRLIERLAANAGGGATINIIQGPGVQAEVTGQRRGPDGGRVIDVMVKSAIDRLAGRGELDRTMALNFGLRRPGR